jgi:hypothetical protein
VSEPLYVRDGSRFVLYDARAQHVPPIPVPQPADLLPGWEDPAQPGRTLLRVSRCPHGHFSRPGGRGRGCSACGR